MAVKKKTELKDHALSIALFMLGVSMFQINNTLKNHIEDCSAKSALVVKVLSGVAILVAGELIMRGFSLFEFVKHQ